jgi:hypothetical protein
MKRKKSKTHKNWPIFCANQSKIIPTSHKKQKFQISKNKHFKTCENSQLLGHTPRKFRSFWIWTTLNGGTDHPVIFSRQTESAPLRAAFFNSKNFAVKKFFESKMFFVRKFCI